MNIIHLVSNRVWGGGERYVLDLARAQRADNNNIAVFCRREPAVADVFAADNLLAGHLRLGGVLDIITPMRLAKYIRSLEGKVVVHVHNFKDAYTALSSRRLLGDDASRVKIVATRHLVLPAKTDRSHLRTLQGLDAIIFVSKIALDEFLSSAPDVDRARLHVVHNSIATLDKISAEKPQSESVRLIFAGRIVPEKGLDTLLRALEKIKELPWQLEICGTGNSRDVMPLVRLSRGAGLEPKIHWAGHVPSAIERMAASDVGVFPSTWREPFGLTILEAFSQGLPVVTTNNGAQPEILTDGCQGLLVPPADPQALADALRRIITDAQLRAEMGREARKAFGTRFSYQNFYNKIMQIYNGC